MSRFYAQTSDSETETESENEIEVPKQQVAAKSGFSDDEEKPKRSQATEKDKRIQELNGLIKQLKNAKNIKDIVKSSEVFELITTCYERSKKTIEKDGIFKPYIRCLAEFDSFINELWADTKWRQTATSNNSAALRKIRQRLRKYCQSFESEIAKFHQKPDDYPEEERAASEEESSEESEDEARRPARAPTASGRSTTAAAAADEESSEEDEDEEEESDEEWSESSSSEESSDIDYEGDDIWKQFLKKPEDEEKEERPKKKEPRKKKQDKQVVEEESETESVVRTERKKLFAKDDEINPKSFIEKLSEICSTRGKKGTDRKEQMDCLDELREIVLTHKLGPGLETKLLFNQIAINFDYNQRLNKCMKPENWIKCLKMVEELLQLLIKNPDIQVGENMVDDTEDTSALPAKIQRIKGCPLTVIDRMVEEFVKILQNCDAHGTEYVDRLKDEPKVCALIDTLQPYLENRGTTQEKCRIYLKKVENLYYKYDKNNTNKSLETIEKLCKYIYKMDNTDRIRTQAMLCHIYHNALHDKWYEARDLMLMSHLQESIEHADIPLQILYNRTMVQVGLCAFRVGNIKESHAALLDIQSSNRAKELLAQGMMTQRNQEKTKEQETKERQRLMPFHMHINLELIECIYLVSAMLIEIPYMCSREYETKKRLISKQFHYQLKLSEKQPVVGPPENMREHVVAASRAMKNADWRSCINYLINEKMNAKVWDLIPQSNNVKTLLTEKVKEESLRTYLFKYSSIYESVSIANLNEMFDLPKSQVYSTISKMIINEELMASLDEPTETVVMHRTEPSRLQTLALQLSEKISTLMDHTERIMQVKGGEIGPMFTRNQQGQQAQQNQQYREGGYHKQQGQWNKQQGKQGKQNRQRQNQKHHQHQHQNQHQNQHHQQQHQQQQHQHQQQQQAQQQQQ